MIPEKRGDTQTSTLTGKKVKFELDPDGTQHLMGVLSDLYADPLMAIIREYSTNARDSHIQAGITRPIELTLPSALQPNLVIQDFGVGLSVDDIEEIYTKYGASTKRETNAAVGMLGLGCKSALASVEQFSLVAIKDGRKIQTSIAKNEEGLPELTVVSDVETTEDNGVKIIIPISASKTSNAEKKANELFRYWPKGSVLVNGKEPKQLESILELKHPDGMRILVVDASNDAYSYDRFQKRHIAVMGGVPYPIELKKNDIHYSKKLVVFADIGDFHFTPSREDLLDTPKSQEFVSRVEANFKEAYETHINNIANKAKSKPEFIKLYNDTIGIVNTGSSSIGSIGNLKFKGKGIPEFFTAPTTIADGNPNYNVNIYKWQFFVCHNKSWAKNSHSKVGKLAITRFPNCIFVANFKPSKFISTHRDKLDDWVTKTDDKEITRISNHTDGGYVLFPGEIPKMIKEWTYSWQHTDWADVLAASREINGKSNTTSGGVTANDSYDSFISGVYSENAVHINELKNSKHCFWFTRPRLNDDNYSSQLRKIRNAQTALSVNYPDALFVLVPLNRVGKLQKNVKHIKEGNSALSEEYKKWVDSLSEEQRKALYSNFSDAYEKRYLELLRQASQFAKFNDPSLKKLIKEFSDITKIKNDPALMQEREKWSKMGFSEVGDSLVKIPYDVKQKYPLIFSSGQTVYSPTEDYLKDIAVYANAKHKTKGKV